MMRHQDPSNDIIEFGGVKSSPTAELMYSREW